MLKIVGGLIAAILLLMIVVGFALMWILTREDPPEDTFNGLGEEDTGDTIGSTTLKYFPSNQ